MLFIFLSFPTIDTVRLIQSDWPAFSRTSRLRLFHHLPTCFSRISRRMKIIGHINYTIKYYTRKFSIILVSLQIRYYWAQTKSYEHRQEQTRNKLTGKNRQERVNRENSPPPFLKIRGWEMGGKIFSFVRK